MANRVVLLDRDGTIIVEREYLRAPEQVELLPNSGRALKSLQDAGFALCIITNQSGIARGYFDLEVLEKIHSRLRYLLRQEGVEIQGIYVCPHLPSDGCDCRKPTPGLAYKASKDLNFDLHNSWMVGDKDIDVQLGHAVGAKTILVRTGYGKQFENSSVADYIANDLSAAAAIILDRNSGS